MFSFVFKAKWCLLLHHRMPLCTACRTYQIKLKPPPWYRRRGSFFPHMVISVLRLLLQAHGCASWHFCCTWQLPIKLDKYACLQGCSIICLTHETGQAINKTAYVCTAPCGITAAGVQTLDGKRHPRRELTQGHSTVFCCEKRRPLPNGFYWRAAVCKPST